MSTGINKANDFMFPIDEKVSFTGYRKEQKFMENMDTKKRYTFEEFEALPQQDGINYELIDGIVYMSPRPAVVHQKISFRLTTAFVNALKNKNCDVVQEIDLVVEGNNLIPDILIVCDEKFEGKRHEKPPLIVVEIISPSSSSRDFIIKMHKYEQLGIQEYWIVVPEEKCIWVIHYPTNKHTEYCSGKAISQVIPDLAIDLGEIFE